MKYLILIPIFFFLKNQESDSITGSYKSTEDSFCNPKMIINIKKDTKTHDLYFVIYKSNKKITNGKLSIRTDENNQKILTMKKVVGIYRNDSIIIQNSGNEMNQYNNLKNCKAKYLIFVKKGK